LERAVQLASSEGLEGLTIGRLAEALAMSKAGLFAHFGSKEDLQLATVEAARTIFIERVGAPALAAAEGLPRLLALCEHWLDYSDAFEGGCFFAAASSEFDGRPGPVRDRIAAIMREWMLALELAVQGAQKLGHVREDADPRQLAFELHALELGANWQRQLLEDASASARARRGMRARIDSITTAAGKRATR
jgi:AcrR family transcriptional regulator